MGRYVPFTPACVCVRAHTHPRTCEYTFMLGDRTTEEGRPARGEAYRAPPAGFLSFSTFPF